MPDQVSVSVKNRKKVVVEIPVDLLKHIAENHPEGPFIITNKLDLAKFVAKRLVDVANPDDAFCQAVDECILLSYEEAMTFIQCPSDEH